MATGRFRCWMPSVTGGLQRILQTRHNVRKLKAVAKRANSTRTLAKPRRRNRRAASCSLRMPKVGSLSTYAGRTTGGQYPCPSTAGDSGVGHQRDRSTMHVRNAHLWCKPRKRGKRGTRSLRPDKLGMVPKPFRCSCAIPEREGAGLGGRCSCRWQHHR